MRRSGDCANGRFRSWSAPHGCACDHFQAGAPLAGACGCSHLYVEHSVAGGDDLVCPFGCADCGDFFDVDLGRCVCGHAGDVHQVVSGICLGGAR